MLLSTIRRFGATLGPVAGFRYHAANHREFATPGSRLGSGDLSQHDKRVWVKSLLYLV
jgi:hypothetical protein